MDAFEEHLWRPFGASWATLRHLAVGWLWRRGAFGAPNQTPGSNCPLSRYATVFRKDVNEDSNHLYYVRLVVEVETYQHTGGCDRPDSGSQRSPKEFAEISILSQILDVCLAQVTAIQPYVES